MDGGVPTEGCKDSEAEIGTPLPPQQRRVQSVPLSGGGGRFFFVGVEGMSVEIMDALPHQSLEAHPHTQILVQE